ncbi:MAG TPA: hypothetical protein DER10_01235 [Elusimicrobia bacterium]|nr:hypothetical protein [Elusimicrobiota bacterium]
MAQKTVLIIEDDTAWHNLLRRILCGAGYNIHIAATCADGVKLAEIVKPDCILSDFHLPDGDAVCICSAIKANKNLKEIPIIIFSSDPGVEIIAYEQCRANTFLVKGQAALYELSETIEKMLSPIISTQSNS